MLVQLLMQGLWETLVMVFISTAVALAVGTPLGVLLVVTSPGHLWPRRFFNQVLAGIINAGRSLPFIILMVAIIPFTRLVVGTSIGTAAAIVPLSVAAIPFVARLVESALAEVDRGVIEAAQAMGATPWQIIRQVLFPEALPALLLGATITAISLVGYSAMAGAIGGGGLGDLAIRYGYQRFQGDVMLATVLVLLALVQLMQSFGDWLARRVRH
ncbi:MAG TPA: ABC transporter permease [Firmicutes bacterium]|nr:ABC transporter permease [Bacillota bacterium]